MWHSIIFCRAGPHRGYLIWWGWEDGQDALITVQNRLVVFAGAADARRYAALHGLPVGDDPVAVYDFDAVQYWIDHPLKKRVDPVLLLRIWNLCIDIAAATRRPFERRARRTDRIYTARKLKCPFASLRNAAGWGMLAAQGADGGTPCARNCLR